MSKLSFRARALDASKSLPIYRDEEIPESADCSNINRTVPQMPTGMEKEEESEHHLQQAICTGTTIPTPEVYTIEDLALFDVMYPPDYKFPRQLIYMQPFSMETDIPDYDMDSEDELWIKQSINAKLELTPDKFEEMMDRLEKGSGQTVVTLQEAKALIKEDDDLIIAVYDYWLNKRLKTQHHLIPQVRTEARHGISNHNPYIAFRRRTEKMQTRKNRKNDESSYEKMLKLKRDLTRALTLLEMIKRREKSKREFVHLSIEVFEKRYQAGDFSGQVINEVMAQRQARPAFQPVFQGNQIPWAKDNSVLTTLNRKEKRQYKKRRHKSSSKSNLEVESGNFPIAPGQVPDFLEDVKSDSTEKITPPTEEDDEGSFPFRRRPNCFYNPAIDPLRSPPRCSKGEDGTGDKYNFFPASLRYDGKRRYIGSARKRIGRGGRLIIDRISHPKDSDDFWRSIGYQVYTRSPIDLYQYASDIPSTPTEEVKVPKIPKIKDVFPHQAFKSKKDDVQLHPSPEVIKPINASKEDESVSSYLQRLNDMRIIPSNFKKNEELLKMSSSEKDICKSNIEEQLYSTSNSSLNENNLVHVQSCLKGLEKLMNPSENENTSVETTLLDPSTASFYNRHFVQRQEKRNEWWKEVYHYSSVPMEIMDEDEEDDANMEPNDGIFISDHSHKDDSTNGINSSNFSQERYENFNVKKGHENNYNEQTGNNTLPSTVSLSVVVSPEKYVNHRANGKTMEIDDLESNGATTSHSENLNEQSCSNATGTMNGDGDCDVGNRRIPLDKDNKENSRIINTTKPRLIAGTGGDEEIAVENTNGDANVPIISSTECSDETSQKPSFLLPSKPWKGTHSVTPKTKPVLL